jgi:hypothetical protein
MGAGREAGACLPHVLPAAAVAVVGGLGEQGTPMCILARLMHSIPLVERPGIAFGLFWSPSSDTSTP